MRMVKNVGLVVAFVLFMSSVSFGALLGLSAPTPPIADVDSFLVGVTYTPGNPMSLMVSGLPASFTMSDSVHHTIVDGIWNIMASVDTSGVASGGSLEILGTCPDVGANSGTLLVGTLDKFGYMDPPGGELFEFVFKVTGGDLAPYYGAEADVQLHATGAGFDGTFDQGFSNIVDYGDFQLATGTADTFAPVPEPASAALVLLGIAALRIRRR